VGRDGVAFEPSAAETHTVQCRAPSRLSPPHRTKALASHHDFQALAVGRRTLSRFMARPVPSDLFLPAAADPLDPGTGGDLEQLTHGTGGNLQQLTHGTSGDRRSPTSC
jgi:hypothetical protein